MIKKISKRTYHLVNKNENLRQLIVYLIIGGASALSDLAILTFLVEFFKIFYLVAATISFVIVATAGFYLHKNYTFRHQGKGNKLRYLVFLLVAGSGLLWSLLFLYLFVSIFKLHYLFAAIIVKFIVLVWNFLMNRFVTFRKLKSEGEEPDIYV